MAKFVPFVEAYRPYKIDDLYGQDNVQKTVRAWLNTGRVPRAILVSGPYGSGKTTVARIIGRTVLCKQVKAGSPCGECGSCQSFDVGRHPDFMENNNASDRGIDAMRDLAQRIRVGPMFGSKRVIVLDEAYALTAQAQGAFLKSLEEPPEHLVIIIATTNPEALLDTIRSRCSPLKIKPVAPEDTAALMGKILADKKVAGIKPDHLLKIARAVGGHPRDALHALDQVYTRILDAQEAGRVLDDQVIADFIADTAVSSVEAAGSGIARSVLEGKAGAGMKRAEDYRQDAEQLLLKITAAMRAAMMRSVSKKLFDPYYEEAIGDLPIFTHKDCQATVLSAYGVFSRLIIDTARTSVPVADVLDESIARAALICKTFLASKDTDQAERPVVTNKTVPAKGNEFGINGKGVEA